MKPGQIAILFLAALAVGAIAVFAGGGGGGDKGSKPKAPAASKDALTITFAYSPEKEVLLKPLIDDFNREQAKQRQPVFVRQQIVASGDAEAKIADGRLKPEVWSPASSLWARQLNFEADRPLTPDESPSLVRTPLVIAMWQPMAEALGWPKTPIGFGDILALARSEQGWASKGRPEYGAFKLVHTNPDFSTAGLSAVVAEYYAATGKKEGLEPADVTGKARAKVRAIERSIVHYGDTTLFIADQMRKGGPGYASAVAMEEATLLDFNKHRGSQPKLVAVYPSEGTFYSDNPFIVMDGDWVSGTDRFAAQRLHNYLASKLSPESAARAGFRPGAADLRPPAPIDAANGADPAQPTRVLGLPQPRVLAMLKKSWRQDRKPANVLLVLDVSGSMRDENRLVNAKQGLKVFLEQVQPQDRVGLTVFSDQISPLVPVLPFTQVHDRLDATISRLIADGGTAAFDATAQGFETVRSLAGTDDRINAVVLLTDGEDTDSTRTVDDVAGELQGQGDSSKQVRVFTIAYSAGAAGAKEALQKLATASGGNAYSGNTKDIEAVYRSISSFF